MGELARISYDHRVWNGTEISRRSSDGYVNATAMCQANDRRWKDYRQSERCQQYLDALETVAGISVHALVESQSGGVGGGGTWIHPRLAVDLARWISPQFAVWMDGWFLEGMQSPAQPALPGDQANLDHVVATLYHAITWLDPDGTIDPTDWAVQPTRRGPLYAMHNCTAAQQDQCLASAQLTAQRTAAIEPHQPQPLEQKAIDKLLAYVRLTNNRLVSAYDAQRLQLLDRFMTVAECQSFLVWLAEHRHVGVMVTTPRYKKPCLCLTLY